MNFAFNQFPFPKGVDKRILVWDIENGTHLCELKGHSDTVYQLTFSRDGTILASGASKISVA